MCISICVQYVKQLVVKQLTIHTLKNNFISLDQFLLSFKKVFFISNLRAFAFIVQRAFFRRRFNGFDQSDTSTTTTISTVWLRQIAYILWTFVNTQIVFLTRWSLFWTHKGRNYGINYITHHNNSIAFLLLIHFEQWTTKRRNRTNSLVCVCVFFQYKWH